MASPDASSNRESYLYEIGKFKDLVRDCNQNNENDHLITVAEGIECLSKFVREHFFFLLKIPKLMIWFFLKPQHKSIFEEADQNKDGQLDRDELRDEVTRIRERMGVMPPKHHGGRGPTTPMNWNTFKIAYIHVFYISQFTCTTYYYYISIFSHYLNLPIEVHYLHEKNILLYYQRLCYLNIELLYKFIWKSWPLILVNANICI